MTSEMTPKPGRIMMYTSGCPKNQNRCCQSTGEPWVVGSKKWVPKWRSVSSIVTAAAITGSAMISRIAYTSIDQMNSGRRFQLMPGARMFTIVT
jgi:hypothetical protein